MREDISTGFLDAMAIHDQVGKVENEWILKMLFEGKNWPAESGSTNTIGADAQCSEQWVEAISASQDRSTSNTSIEVSATFSRLVHRWLGAQGQLVERNSLNNSSFFQSLIRENVQPEFDRQRRGFSG